MCFCVCLPALGAILIGFSGILPEFSTNQNFWERACTPASYTIANNSVKLEVYQVMTL